MQVDQAGVESTPMAAAASHQIAELEAVEAVGESAAARSADAEVVVDHVVAYPELVGLMQSQHGLVSEAEAEAHARSGPLVHHPV